MKKYLILLFLIIFIAPSVAFASWWKPSTWKIFNKKRPTPQTQVINIEKEKTPEEKILDLQKQLDELKTQKPTSDLVKEPIINKNIQTKNGSSKKTVDVVDIQKKENTENNALGSTSRLLTEKERSDIKEYANSVIERRNSSISTIQKVKNSRSNSSYSKDYLELFEVCDTVIKYLEEDKEITSLMLKLANKETTTSEQMEYVFKEWLAIIKESDKEFSTIFGGFANLVKLNDELVTAIIKNDAIEEVARRNNIPLNYSNNGLSAEYYANERVRLEKRADDILKESMPKEKERINNFLIIFYKY